jgi:phage-related protein
VAGNSGDAYIVGAVGVSVEPIATDFWRTFEAKTKPGAAKAGGDLGKAIAGPLAKAVAQSVAKGIRDGSAGAQRAAVGAGGDIGTAIGVPLARKMADAITKGLTDGTRAAKAKASGAGDSIGDSIARPIKDKTSKSIGDGVEEGGRKAKPKARQQGEETGGAFGEAFRRRVEAAVKALPDAKIDADTTEAEFKLGELRARLQALRNAKIGIDIDEGAALAELATIREQLRDLSRRAPEVSVRVDAAAAELHLAAIQAQVDRVDADRATVKVDVDGGPRVVAELEAVDAATGAATSSGAGLSGSVVGWTTAIITLAPLAAAAIAGVGVATLSVGAALGVGALAIAPLVGAVQALNTQQTNAAQTAVTLSGRQNAIASANDQVRNSTQSLTQAQLEAQRAQQALTQARIDAKRALEDLDSQVKNNAIDQRQANLDLTQAQQNLAIAQAGGAAGQITGPGVVAPIVNPLAVQEAQLAFDRAKQHADDLSSQGKRLTQDQATAQKRGVEGSTQVVSAQDRVANAQEAIIRATEGIAAAQRAVKQAYASASIVGSTGANSVAEAMKNLSPAGQAFARFLFDLKPLLLDLSKAAQNGLFPGLEKGIKTLLPLAPQVTSFVTNIAKTMGDLFAQFAADLRSPFWQDFFKFLAANAGPILRDIAGVLRSVAKDVARFLEAFGPAYAKIGPFITALSNFLTNVLIGLAPSATVFLDALTGLLVNLGPALGPLTTAFSDIFVALSPLLPLIGAVLADALTEIATVISGVAGAVGPFVKILADAFTPVYKTLFPVIVRLAATVLPPLTEAFAQMATALAPILPVLGQVATQLAQALLPILPQIGKILAEQVVPALALFGQQVAVYLLAFLRALLPHLPELLALFGQLAVVGLQLVAAFLPLLPSLVQLATLVLDLSLKSGFLDRAIGLVVVGMQIALIVIPLVTALVQAQVGAFVWLIDHAKTLGRFIGIVWRDQIHPVLKSFGEFMGQTVVPAFKSAVNTISSIWGGLKEAFADPIRFVISTVLNGGLFAAYNWIADLFKLPTRNVHVPLPAGLAAPKGTQTFGAKGFSSGGFTGPGGKYEPAGIVHAGEYVIPKEIVSGLGIRFFDDLIGKKKSSRPGDGSEGIAFPGFADGGFVGWVKDAFATATDPVAVLKDKALGLFDHIPGAAIVTSMLTGVGKSIVGGVADYLTGHTTDKSAMLGKYVGPLSPTMQSTQAFIKAQAGKPYIWASAGPIGYDCSGLMSAAFNILHGHSPYAHTFSTSNEASYFPKPGFGPFTAGWAHAGQRGGGSVGHTAGNLGGLAFESRGGVGVLVGSQAAPVTSFANVGTYDAGGWLNPGDIAVNRGARPEAVLTPVESDALLKGVRGSDGATYNYNIAGRPDFTIADLLALEARRAALQREGRPY